MNCFGWSFFVNIKKLPEFGGERNESVSVICAGDVVYDAWPVQRVRWSHVTSVRVGVHGDGSAISGACRAVGID